jgi:hypothetical protein
MTDQHQEHGQEAAHHRDGQTIFLQKAGTGFQKTSQQQHQGCQCYGTDSVDLENGNAMLQHDTHDDLDSFGSAKRGIAGSQCPCCCDS